VDQAAAVTAVAHRQRATVAAHRAAARLVAVPVDQAAARLVAVPVD
jgi:hypothetical protein